MCRPGRLLANKKTVGGGCPAPRLGSNTEACLKPWRTSCIRNSSHSPINSKKQKPSIFLLSHTAYPLPLELLEDRLAGYALQVLSSAVEAGFAG
jgi:hypothetical protein